MIELMNDRHLSDWSAICNTPDSRLYKRLIELRWTETPVDMCRSQETDELQLIPGRTRPQDTRASALPRVGINARPLALRSRVIGDGDCPVHDSIIQRTSLLQTS